VEPGANGPLIDTIVYWMSVATSPATLLALALAITMALIGSRARKRE
jgi:hypothetical protein